MKICTYSMKTTPNKEISSRFCENWAIIPQIITNSLLKKL